MGIRPPLRSNLGLRKSANCTAQATRYCIQSATKIGAVLLQGGRPIAFESRKLSPAEHNYMTGKIELVASVHAMRTWRCFLEGVSRENAMHLAAILASVGSKVSK